MRTLPRLAINPQFHREVVRVGNFVRSDNPRPKRAERVNALAKAEHAGLHLAALNVARGDIIKNHVAADVVGRLLRA